MEIFPFDNMRKKVGNKKESCLLLKGRFLFSCVLLRFGNTLGFMPSRVPLPQENALV
jgi:hypothetical protein